MLGKHPDINLCSIKEPNFFNLPDDTDGTWDRGLNWYRSLFPSRGGLKGEASTSYSKFPLTVGVPSRIFALNPDIRLLYIVRDPVERMISHYLHNVVKGGETRSLLDAFADPVSNYFCTSMSYLQLQQFLNYFSRQQILVMNFEDLRANPQAVAAKVFRFLGVRSDAVEIRDHWKANTTIERISSLAASQAPLCPSQKRLLEVVAQSQCERELSITSIGVRLGLGPQLQAKLSNRFEGDRALLFKHFDIAI